MADAPQKVIVKSSRIDASILPPNFPLPYKLYVIQQTTDLKDIADASNGANELAYEATVKNSEQDATLDDHENRIAGLRSEVDDHESRITANT
ncbi:UNVERIFIED_ASMBLY: phage tail protein, partial [Cronobacter sakazakii]